LEGNNQEVDIRFEVCREDNVATNNVGKNYKGFASASNDR